MALLTCRDVAMSYEGREVLDGVSFSLERGDYLCIVGENGSGKSTLIKGILGLRPLSSGSIEFDDPALRHSIGYLPQQTAIQRAFPACVMEIVLSGCLRRRGLPFYTKADRAKALENLAKLGLQDFANRSYRELSGGQQQRVLLARALCAADGLLLLDEPVTGLDPLAQSQMYSLVRRLNREQQMTVIMVSHDIQFAVANANRILHLGGKTLFCGSCEDYIKSSVGRAYLGGPEDA